MARATAIDDSPASKASSGQGILNMLLKLFIIHALTMPKLIGYQPVNVIVVLVQQMCSWIPGHLFLLSIKPLSY